MNDIVVSTNDTHTVNFASVVHPYGHSSKALSDDIILAAAVPEPASWEMMIVGIGAIGHTMRHRTLAMRVSYAA